MSVATQILGRSMALYLNIMFENAIKRQVAPWPQTSQRQGLGVASACTDGPWGGGGRSELTIPKKRADKLAGKLQPTASKAKRSEAKQSKQGV